MNKYKQYTMKMMEVTENPMTPMIMNKLIGSIESLGPILAGKADKDRVHKLSDRLMKDFTDEELEHGGREMVMALMSCLVESIRVWVRETIDGQGTEAIQE